MERIIEANIERFKKLLAVETDPTKKVILLRLLSEEEEKKQQSDIAHFKF
ncbi:MAG: hypothetical protein ACXWKC_11735 [Xanthobacteraceae bacterium]